MAVPKSRRIADWCDDKSAEMDEKVSQSMELFPWAIPALILLVPSIGLGLVSVVIRKFSK